MQTSLEIRKCIFIFCLSKANKMWNKSTSIWWRHFIAPFRLVSWDSFYMILTEMILTRPSSWEDATFLRSNFTPGGKKCRSPPHFESFQPHYFSRTINFSLLISLSLSFRREGGGDSQPLEKSGKNSRNWRAPFRAAGMSHTCLAGKVKLANFYFGLFHVAAVR